MLTIAPVVLSYNRRKDGTFNVKLRVTWKGRSRYLATNIMCGRDDLTRSLKIKSPAVLDRCSAMIRETREAVADLSPALMEQMTVEDVVRVIKSTKAKQTFRLDFFDYADRFCQKKAPQTRRSYTAALGALERWLGKRSLDVNEITKAMLVEFAAAVEEAPKVYFNHYKGKWEESKKTKLPQGQSSRHLAKLAAIYNAAKDEYNDEDAGLLLIPRNPFRGVKLVFPKAVTGQHNLGIETVQRIISAETDDPGIRTALDTFVVSFCLMGANLADLYAARPFRDDTWTYNRRKTKNRRADGAEMRVVIPSQIRPFLGRLRGHGEWWLNVLHDMNPNPEQITGRVNRALKRWAESEGLEVFTLGAARHSWATIARNNARIDKATVDECLCHVGDLQIADIYIERGWDIINKANTEVLALFDFPM